MKWTEISIDTRINTGECEAYRSGSGRRADWRRGTDGGGDGRGRRRGAGAAIGDDDVGGTAAVVSFRRDDLVVEGAESEASCGPRSVVVSGRDGAARAVALTDRPVLVEGCGTLNRRLVHALVEVDIVDGSIGGDGSLVGAARRGIIGAEVFDDVVFNERAGEPPVDGEVAVSVRAVGTGETDRPRTRIV